MSRIRMVYRSFDRDDIAESQTIIIASNNVYYFYRTITTQNRIWARQIHSSFVAHPSRPVEVR